MTFIEPAPPLRANMTPASQLLENASDAKHRRAMFFAGNTGEQRGSARITYIAYRHTYIQTDRTTDIHTYITLHNITLLYFTLHYITLHYITYIHTLHYTTLHFSRHFPQRPCRNLAGAPGTRVLQTVFSEASFLTCTLFLRPRVHTTATGPAAATPQGKMGTPREGHSSPGKAHQGCSGQGRARK